MVITGEGQKYLGSAIGKQTFIESYVQQKVTTWIDELDHLSSIAITQPHAAFAAFTHGVTSRWTYLARTTPNIEDLIKPLEETIRKVFLPNLTGQNAFNNMGEGLAGTTSSSWGTWYSRSLQEECGTLLYMRDNLSTSCRLDSRPVRDICT